MTDSLPPAPKTKSRYQAVVPLAVSCLGLVAAALCSSLLIRGAAQEAEQTRATARRDLQSVRKEVGGLKVERDRLRGEIARAREDLKKTEAALSTRSDFSNYLLSQLSETQVDQALDAPAAPTETLPICYVKHHDDPASLALAKRASSVLRSQNWIAPVYVAHYQGPGKRTGYVAQVRYSGTKMRPKAEKAASILNRGGVPTWVNSVPEPSGQERYLRLWILH